MRMKEKDLESRVKRSYQSNLYTFLVGSTVLTTLCARQNQTLELLFPPRALLESAPSFPPLFHNPASNTRCLTAHLSLPSVLPSPYLQDQNTCNTCPARLIQCPKEPLETSKRESKKPSTSSTGSFGASSAL